MVHIQFGFIDGGLSSQSHSLSVGGIFLYADFANYRTDQDRTTQMVDCDPKRPSTENIAGSWEHQRATFAISGSQRLLGPFSLFKMPMQVVAGQMGIFPATKFEHCPFQDSNQLQPLPFGVDAGAE